MELNTTAIITAVIVSTVGGSGFIGLVFWWVKKTITDKDSHLHSLLEKMDNRQEEHGRRLHGLEVAGFATLKEVGQLLKDETTILGTSVKEVTKELNTLQTNLALTNERMKGLT